jgi:hypothetical protein
MLSDGSALIYIGTSAGRRDPSRPAAGQPRDTPGEYVLERAGHEPVILGRSGSDAYQSLVALRAQVRASRVRCGYCGSTDLGEDEQRQGICRSCIPDAMEDARGDAICDERRGK